MQRFRISIVATIAVLMITSCDKNVTMFTEINRDGSCTRQITTKDDCYLDDESWEMVAPQDSSDHETVILRRSFSDVVEMASNPILSVNDEPVRSDASLSISFKWFYTDYKFTETFLNWKDHSDIKITDFVSQDEADFMLTGYPNLVDGLTGGEMVDVLDKLQEKMELWEYSVLTNCQLELIRNHYADIANPPVDKATFVSLRDSIIRFGNENDYDPTGVIKDLLKDYFKSDAYDIFFTKSRKPADFAEEYEAEGNSIIESTIGIMLIKAPYYLKMPGRVTDAGRGTVTDGVIKYRFEGNFLASNDYTITATSRAVNYWAFILSGLVVLLALASLLYRKK